MAQDPRQPANKRDNILAIQETLKSDTWVSQFAREGKELLDKTDQPNVITEEQFVPFLPIFNLDKDRYGAEKDVDYTNQIHRLYNQYIHGLGINLYEVTYVIKSVNDPTVVGFLNRRFTRIKTDHVEGASSRENIPAVVARNSGATRDGMILEASVRDLVQANSSPDQMDYFRRAKMESALIQKNFTEQNQTADKRPTTETSSTASSPSSDDDMSVILIDGD